MNIVTQKKRCSKCGEKKLLSEFGRDRSYRDSLNGRCKACECDRVRRYRAANPDKIRKALQSWKKANPDKVREANRKARQRYRKINPEKISKAAQYYYETNRDKIQEKNRRWRETNPDKAREGVRAWRKANRDRARKTARDWYKRNHDKILSQAAVRDHRRRIRKLGNGGSYTTEEWKAICERQAYRCACCGEKRKLEVDHILPIAKGGRNDITNIQALCKPCNLSKGTKHLDYRST